jgi:hypothetical protein
MHVFFDMNDVQGIIANTQFLLKFSVFNLAPS